MKNILVIEDEYDIIALLTIILENEGYKVSTMSNATGYETKLREAHADLVLLDLNVGGVNGRQICEYIKAHDDLKSIPVILMSASMDAERIKEECGAEDLISKPFDLNYFIGTVKRFAN
jgi:DNA-binding response OmpR family regulator